VGFVHLQLGGHDAATLTGNAAFAVAFLAGFSERLVPDLHAKTSSSVTTAAAASKPISATASGRRAAIAAGAGA
jgi:hypothetical protein